MPGDHDHTGQLARYGMCLTCADRGHLEAADRAAPAEQLTLPEPVPEFDGATYDHDRDHLRLGAQAQRVVDLMRDGQWRTLSEIATATGDPEASVSARLRDLRKPKFGRHDIGRRQRDESMPGLYEYRWQPNHGT